MSVTPLRAALYTRISQDDTGQELGVTRQMDDCRRIAEMRGWTVVAELTDNDISAFSGEERPDYERLRALVAAREIDAVVVYHLSRLWRSRKQRSEGIELFKLAGIKIVAVSGPELDMSHAYGRGMADVLGSFDTMESDVKSERVALAARQRAELGNPNGAIPYGWKRVIETDERGRRIGAHDVKHPDEAPIVKEICERLLTGQSLHAVTAWLNDSGVLPPGADFEFKKKPRGLDNPDGTRWGKTTVKKLALRAQNCGMRIYHQGREDERLLPMKAEPIISKEQWEALQALLRNPERSRNNGGARKFLLSHNTVGRCGVCGGPLRHAVSRHHTKGGELREYHMYTCAQPKGCVGRNQPKTDLLVAARVADRLSKPDARDLLVRDNTEGRAALEELDLLQKRLDGAAGLSASGDIDEMALARISRELRPKIEEARARAMTGGPDLPFALVDQISAFDVYEQWKTLTITQRVDLLKILGATVTILPRGKTGPGFEADSVEVTFIREPTE